jgi:hypothetical protein
MYIFHISLILNHFFAIKKNIFFIHEQKVYLSSKYKIYGNYFIHSNSLREPGHTHSHPTDDTLKSV